MIGGYSVTLGGHLLFLTSEEIEWLGSAPTRCTGCRHWTALHYYGPYDEPHCNFPDCRCQTDGEPWEEG